MKTERSSWSNIPFDEIKGMVYPTLEICWKYTRPQAIEDVKFVSSTELIWRNLALHHLFTNGSSAVSGCRQNESPNRWQKLNNHLNSSPLINVKWKGLPTSKFTNIFVRSVLSSFRSWTLLDLSIFISWFRRDNFFTEESNILNRGLVF